MREKERGMKQVYMGEYVATGEPPDRRSAVGVFTRIFPAPPLLPEPGPLIR